MRTSPTPVSPSSVITCTKVRLRQAVPSTRLVTSTIFILHVLLFCYLQRQSRGPWLRLNGVWIIACQQVQAETRTVNTFPAQSKRSLFKVFANRIDIGSIAQAKFQINWCGNTHDFGDLVESYKPTKVIWHLHINIEGNIHGLADGRDLR